VYGASTAPIRLVREDLAVLSGDHLVSPMAAASAPVPVDERAAG